VTTPLTGITKEEVARAMELQEQGLPVSGIAKVLGQPLELMKSALVAAKKSGFEAWGAA
jgi:hypothetical protein